VKLLRNTPVVLLALLLAGYVAYPIATLFHRSVEVEGTLSLERYGELLSPSNVANLEALANSVAVSLLSVATSAVVGCFLAIALTQLKFRGRDTLARLAILPIGLPPLVGTIAILLAFGESGVVPRLMNRVLDGWVQTSGFSGISGILLVHTYSFYVYFYLMVSTAIHKFDGGQVEAAATLGAGPWRIFRKVLLPGLRPSVVGASVLTFMASMASFTAPLLFAGGHRFLTLQIYFTKLNGDLDTAAAQSVLLAIVSLAFFVVARLTARDWTSRTASKGVTRKAQLAFPVWPRRAAVAGSFAVVGLTLLPFLIILVLSFAREGSWTWQILPQSYTMENYLGFFRDAHLYEPVLNSMWMTLVTMVVTGVLGLGIAWSLSHLKQRSLARTIEILLAAPYALPGTVVAIALIQAFAQPTILAGGDVLVGTLWILPLAYIFRMYPLVLQPSSAALETLDPAIEEAAATLGSSRWRTFWSVVFPAIRPALFSGVLLAGIMAIGEFVASILLYSYNSRPVSVEIFSQLRMFNIGNAAAYSVLLVVLVVGMIAVNPERKVGGVSG
jgi:iron(III) transport system permease protein